MPSKHKNNHKAVKGKLDSSDLPRASLLPLWGPPSTIIVIAIVVATIVTCIARAPIAAWAIQPIRAAKVPFLAFLA